MAPVVLINAVGLTPRLLPFAPRLSALAQQGWSTPMRDVLPSVTCSAQATILTGKSVREHGIVGNGWLFRDTTEVRFWQQSNRLLQAEPLYVTARKRAAERGGNFRCAKLFWWFNQGADVALSVTPKPFYGIDGGKIFGITGTPSSYSESLERDLGAFPFHTFWGPKAGLPCTRWIGRAAAHTIEQHSPDLTLVYLPHLDYDPQRFGPQGCDMKKLVGELDNAAAPILDAAKKQGAQVWVVSEYGHCQVSRPIYINRVLREAGLIAVRGGPYGEQLDLYNCRAFAVCEHQLAHIYISNPDDIPLVRNLLGALPGVGQVIVGEEKSMYDLDHPRSGEIVALSEADAWFAYPYWTDSAVAPDYARAVAIHHKPGYDPCELIMDPKLKFPLFHVIRKLIRKKLGFRTIFDVVPLDASLVKGSHGLIAADPQDGPLLVGHGAKPSEAVVPMTAVRDLILRALFD